MAKIIYKEGMEGQNNLSSIEGIEIDLLNGQKALIFPKYSGEPLLREDQIDKWNARILKEIEALKVEDTARETEALFNLGSPAAKWVLMFVTEDGRRFSLPSLIAALETQYQKKEIDALAETIEGADLLRDFTFYVFSCSRCDTYNVWAAGGDYGLSNLLNLFIPYLAVPTILYR